MRFQSKEKKKDEPRVTVVGENRLPACLPPALAEAQGGPLAASAARSTEGGASWQLPSPRAAACWPLPPEPQRPFHRQCRRGTLLETQLAGPGEPRALQEGAGTRHVNHRAVKAVSRAGSRARMAGRDGTGRRNTGDAQRGRKRQARRDADALQGQRGRLHRVPQMHASKF